VAPGEREVCAKGPHSSSPAGDVYDAVDGQGPPMYRYVVLVPSLASSSSSNTLSCGADKVMVVATVLLVPAAQFGTQLMMTDSP
jgi:hypothetical protein